MKHIYAYIRVSSKEQNTDRQSKAIAEYCNTHGDLEVTEAFVDRASGKDFERAKYIEMKTKVRKGDLVIIKELDRLGRNMEQIKEEWQALTKKGADIVIIDTPLLNTRDKTNLEKQLIANIVFELLTYMAEKERVKIRSRQAEGIQALRDRNNGHGIGRPKVEVPPESFIREYHKWQAGEYGNLSAVKFAKLQGIGRSTLYKYINLLGGVNHG